MEYAFEKALGLFTGDLDQFIAASPRGKVNGYGCSDPEFNLAKIVKFYGRRADPAVVRDAVHNNSLE